MPRNTDYEFVSTDTETLEALMVASYEKITGVNVRPASPEKLFIQWVTSIILQERVLNNYTGNQNIPSRSEGSNLDALGELFYTSDRPPAKQAVCVVRFHISAAQSTSILVPKGTRVTDISSTLIWETVEDAYVQIGDTYVDIHVRCQTAGEIGNGYVVGQLNTIVDLYDYYSGCENITQSDGGADAATDEEFYEIMRESMDAYSTAGPAGAYIYHAKSVSTEIADVAAVRPKVNIGTSLPLYSLSGVKYAFLGGDTLDLATLIVHPSRVGTAAEIGTDYEADYEDGLLKISIVPTGALAGETNIDVEIEAINGGRVDIYILMDDGTIATQTIKDAALAACNDETVRPLTDFVSVKDPEQVPYNIQFTYYIPSGSATSSADIEAAVQKAVDTYKAWQSGKLGRDINPSQLTGELMKTGIKRYVITSPTYQVLHDGKDGSRPQIATIGTVEIINGGQEDE